MHSGFRPVRSKCSALILTSVLQWLYTDLHQQQLLHIRQRQHTHAHTLRTVTLCVCVCVWTCSIVPGAAGLMIDQLSFLQPPGGIVPGPVLPLPSVRRWSSLLQSNPFPLQSQTDMVVHISLSHTHTLVHIQVRVNSRALGVDLSYQGDEHVNSDLTLPQTSNLRPK